MSGVKHTSPGTPYIPVVLDDMGLTPAEFRIVCRIARRGECFEAVAGMAAACRMNKKTAWAALARLLDLAIISANRRHGTTTVYRLRPSEEWSTSANGFLKESQPELSPTPSSGPTQNETQPELIPGPSNGSDPTQTETHHPTQNESRKGSPIKVTRKVKCVRAPFIVPTLEEVEAYFIEDGVPVLEAEKFVDYYEDKNWMTRKGPMKDWKYACRNWKRIGVERGWIKESNSQHSSAPSAELSQKEIKRRKLAESLH